MRAEEATAFREWANSKGWKVFFAFAKDSKWLGGAICVRNSFLSKNNLSVQHLDIVPHYVHALGFLQNNQQVGCIVNLYFDSSSKDVRISQIHRLGEFFEVGAGSAWGMGPWSALHTRSQCGGPGRSEAACKCLAVGDTMVGKGRKGGAVGGEGR